MSNNKSNLSLFTRLAIGGLLALPVLAGAQVSAASSSSGSSAGSGASGIPANGSVAEIQKIAEEMSIMSARLAQLELKAKIAVKQKEIKLLDTTQAVTPSLSPLGSAIGAPSVVSVAGLKGNVEAVLIFPGGATQRVKRGDVIGDRKVSVVSLNEVVLTDMQGKNVQRLAFGSIAPTRDSTSTGSAGLPSMPVMPGVPGTSLNPGAMSTAR